MMNITEPASTNRRTGDVTDARSTQADECRWSARRRGSIAPSSRDCAFAERGEKNSGDSEIGIQEEVEIAIGPAILWTRAHRGRCTALRFRKAPKRGIEDHAPLTLRAQDQGGNACAARMTTDTISR